MADPVFSVADLGEGRLILSQGLKADLALRKIFSQYADNVMTDWIIAQTEKA